LTFIGRYDFTLVADRRSGRCAAATYANVNRFQNGSLARCRSVELGQLARATWGSVFYQWQIGKVCLNPLKAAWEHEYLYSVLPITAGFAHQPDRDLL
jgi:hypothetical protein